MSIEDKLSALTDAVDKLTVQLSAVANDVSFGNTSATKSVSEAKTETTKKAEVKSKSSKKAEKTPDPVDELDDLEASDEGIDDGLGLDDDEPKSKSKVTVEELKELLGVVSKKKGRETVLKLFKKFEVATFNDVEPSQYAAMFKAANELLGG